MPAEGQGGGRERTSARRAVLAALAAVMIVLGAVLAARADVLTAPPSIPVELADGAPALLVASDWGVASLSELRPGAPAYWFVDAWVVGVEGARLTLEIRKDGDLMEVPNGVSLVVERCAEEWLDGPAAPSCTQGRAVVARIAPADDLTTSSPTYWLEAVGSRDPSYVLVTLLIEDTPENRADSALMGLTGSLGLGITAVEATPVATEPPTEPPTEVPTGGPTDGPTGGPTAGPIDGPTGGAAVLPGAPPVAGGDPDQSQVRPGSGMLPTTGAAAALLVWVAGLGLVSGGVLVAASAARTAASAAGRRRQRTPEARRPTAEARGRR